MTFLTMTTLIPDERSVVSRSAGVLPRAVDGVLQTFSHGVQSMLGTRSTRSSRAKVIAINCVVGLAVWGSLDLAASTSPSPSPCHRLACATALPDR